MRDLAFTPDGALWIASAGAAPALRGRAPRAAYDEDRDALRVAVTAHAAVATAGGVYWSCDGVRFARVDAALGESPAAGLALEEYSGVADAALDCVGARCPRTAASRESVQRAWILPLDLRPALDVTAFGGARVRARTHAQLLELADGGTFRAQPTECTEFA